MESYQIASILHGDDQVVDSCFHANGNLLVTATKDSIQLIDSLSGESKKKIFTKTHGNRNIAYTHHEQCVLASSRNRRNNNDIRYLSMYDNRYLRLFKGHDTQVTSLAMSPVDDCFLSSSADRAVCLWSLTAPSPIARLTLPEECANPKVAYTHDGLLFGVMARNNSASTNCIRLFDARSYDKGPFLQLRPSRQQLQKALKRSNPQLDSFQHERCLSSPWVSFCFSPDGTRALVSTACGLLISLDAFNDDGDPVTIFTEAETRVEASQSKGLALSQTASLGCCFTPDSRHVLAATADCRVLVCNPLSGRTEGELPGQLGHVTPVTSVCCNPKYEVVATSGINTYLWLKSSLFTGEESGDSHR